MNIVMTYTRRSIAIFWVIALFINACENFESDGRENEIRFVLSKEKTERKNRYEMDQIDN